MKTRLTLPAVVLVVSACAAPRIMTLQPSRGVAGTDQGPLRVVVNLEDVLDPLPLQGGHVQYGDLSRALQEVVRTETSAWARQHQSRRVGGWDLKIDLVQTTAELTGGHVTVESSARVTLTATLGQVYLGQTRVHCRQTALDDPTNPTLPVNACLAAMAHELAGWLEGLQP